MKPLPGSNLDRLRRMREERAVIAARIDAAVRRAFAPKPAPKPAMRPSGLPQRAFETHTHPGMAPHSHAGPPHHWHA